MGHPIHHLWIVKNRPQIMTFDHSNEAIKNTLAAYCLVSNMRGAPFSRPTQASPGGAPTPLRHHCLRQTNRGVGVSYVVGGEQ